MREEYLFRTQIWRTCLKLAALAVLCGSSASANQVNVLYWIEYDGGPTAIPGALAGDIGTAAASEADFDSMLASGSWSAVVVDIENEPFSYYEGEDASLLGNLTAYVNDGGILIGDNWGYSGDTDFYSLFQATVEGTNASCIPNDGSPLFNGVPADGVSPCNSQDISVSNAPALSVYDVTYDPTGAATGYGFGPSGTGPDGYGIIQASSGSGMTFLNGPLADAYTNLDQGEQLIANELGYASSSSGPAVAPEPGTMVLFAAGFATVAVYRRRRRRT